MSFNTFGHLFRVTTFGESHGVAIGCVVDGCPPRIPLTDGELFQPIDVIANHRQARSPELSVTQVDLESLGQIGGIGLPG